MIKEALEYIVGLKTPVITEIDGNTYSDKPLNRIGYVPYAKTIAMKTLTTLVEYIKANIDSMSEKMIVHVISPTEVHLYSSLDADRKREYLVEVNAELPDFRFGSFIDHENFVIALQSKFVPNEDRDLVLKFAGRKNLSSISSVYVQGKIFGDFKWNKKIFPCASSFHFIPADFIRL